MNIKSYKINLFLNRAPKKKNRLLPRLVCIFLLYLFPGFSFAQLPPCAPIPDNCICYGDFESFDSDSEATLGLQGSPIIEWYWGYEVSLGAPMFGNPTQSLKMANCGSPTTPGEISDVSSIVLPMSCTFNPCDEADLSFMARSPHDPTYSDHTLYFRFLQQDPISDHPSNDLYDIPFVMDPAQYFDVEIPLSSDISWSSYLNSIVNTTPNSYDYVLIWFGHVPATSCYIQYLDNVKLEITSTSVVIPPLPIPETICKDAGCFDLTDDLPGVYTASGPGVTVAYDIYGNEHWRFCPDAAGVGIHTITICNASGCCIDIDIEVLEGPSPVIGGATFTTCVGEAVTICPLVGVDGPYEYEWASGETTECITVTPGIPGGIITTVTAYSESGCATTVNIIVTVYDLPTIIAPDVNVCYLGSVELTASADVIADLDWFDQTGTYIDSGESILVSPVGLPGSTIEYTVTVEDPTTGCIATEIIEITILFLPDVSDVDGNEYCSGSGYPLPNPTDCGEWTGLYITESGGDYFFSPIEGGPYELTFTTCDGCEATATVTVIEATFNITSIVNSCDGGDCNGMVTFDSGGPIYDWDILEDGMGMQTGSTVTFDGLCPGIYNVMAFQTEEPFCGGWQTFEIEEEASEWAKTTSESGYQDFANDVCHDLLGDVYSVGNFTKNTNFDDLLVSAADPLDELMYISSYSQCGELNWVASGFSTAITAARVAINHEYNLVYVVGSFEGNAVFSAGLAEDESPACIGGLGTYTTAATQGAYVAVYNTEGCLLHVEEFPSSAGAILEGQAIATEAYVNMVHSLDHRVYVTTKKSYGTPSLPTFLYVNALTPIFEAPYTFSFASNWQRELSSAVDATISDIEVFHGHIGFVGSFKYNLTMTGMPDLLGNYADNDAFVYFWADHDITPYYVWNKDLYDTTDPYDGNAYTITMDNNVIIIGGDYTIAETSAFDGGIGLPTAMGTKGGFVAKFNFPGTMSWISRIESNDSASVRSMDQASNTLYIGGNFTGNDYFIDGILQGTFGFEPHTFVTRWNVPLGPAPIEWSNVSISEGSPSFNTGLTFYNQQVFTCGYHSGDMNQSISSTDWLTSTPLGAQNAYVWRFNQITGNARNAPYFEDENDVESLKFSVFPNPSRGIFEFEMKNNNAPVQLEITNILGEIIYQQMQTKLDGLTLDLSDQSKGVYFIRIFTKGQMQTQKLVLH